jgi:hypothetical protein
MLFKPPEVDVGRHIEMRIRRVFPISLESALKQSYEEALRRLREATELEKQAYQLTMEKAILEHRLSIWDWLGKNLGELSEALTTGNYESAKSLIQAIQEEAKRRSREEQYLLSKVQSGKSVSSQIGTPSFPRSFVDSGVASQPTQPSSNVTEPTVYRPPVNITSVPAEKPSPLPSPNYPTVQPAPSAVKTSISEAEWRNITSSLQPANFSTYKPLFSPTQIPAFNPFQQSGFYNPFR